MTTKCQCFYKLFDLVLLGFYKRSMTTNYVTVKNLKVSKDLLSFVNDELLKDLDIAQDKFWSQFDQIVHSLAPKNKELLKVR